jgi:hypothetical protein
MKSKYHQIVDHKIEITEIGNEFFVSIDGLPLNRPHAEQLSAEQRQARFSSAQNAFEAANLAICKQRRFS